MNFDLSFTVFRASFGLFRIGLRIIRRAFPKMRFACCVDSSITVETRCDDVGGTYFSRNSKNSALDIDVMMFFNVVKL